MVVVTLLVEIIDFLGAVMWMMRVMCTTVIVIEVLRCCDEVVKFWILGSLDLLDLVGGEARLP